MIDEVVIGFVLLVFTMITVFAEVLPKSVIAGGLAVNVFLFSFWIVIAANRDAIAGGFTQPNRAGGVLARLTQSMKK